MTDQRTQRFRFWGWSGERRRPGLGPWWVLFALILCCRDSGHRQPWTHGAVPQVAIHEVQGRRHVSPLVGETVRIEGVVTAVAPEGGFYLQNLTPDEDVSTSEGIFVATPDIVRPGDLLQVTGTVEEQRGRDGDLSTTRLAGDVQLRILSRSGALPEPVLLGRGGRMPPAQVAGERQGGNVESIDVVDPERFAIDFYESLEGMRVALIDALVVGPTNRYGEITVLADRGVQRRRPSAGGGVLLAPDDFNPERIHLDDALMATPQANVGDVFAGRIEGVLGYSFGRFKLLVTAAPPHLETSQRPNQVAPPVADDQLSLATFNVENLDPDDDPQRFAALARQIVRNLQSPDLLALQEVQDSSGPRDDGVVEATATYRQLITAIEVEGGPRYTYREIAPRDGEDGGEPGGNIRVGFLFRNDRGLRFIDRPGGDALGAVAVVAGSGGAELTASPGRIEPGHRSFASSRKPLVAELSYRGHRLFVVVTHLSSKRGDDPLFGWAQPPARYSEGARIEQARIIRQFVSQILQTDPAADVVVLGDMNDFEFSATLATLAGSELTNLMERLPLSQRYTYIYAGNSQVLDHILVSGHLAETGHPEPQVIHANADLNHDQRASDHDPVLLRLRLP